MNARWFIVFRPQTFGTGEGRRAEVGASSQKLTVMLTDCRALLPDLIKFAYVPSIELRIHAVVGRKERDASPDFSMVKLPELKQESALPGADDDEQVLVLDFLDGPKGQKNPNSK